MDSTCSLWLYLFSLPMSKVSLWCSCVQIGNICNNLVSSCGLLQSIQGWCLYVSWRTCLIVSGSSIPEHLCEACSGGCGEATVSGFFNLFPWLNWEPLATVIAIKSSMCGLHSPRPFYIFVGFGSEPNPYPYNYTLSVDYTVLVLPTSGWCW